jgi:hypothetical protein
MKFPWHWRLRNSRATFKPLDNQAGFLLDVDGRRVVALKVPATVAKDIAGHDISLAEGMLRKFAQLRRANEPSQWLVVANMENSLIGDNTRFRALVGEVLTQATGFPVTVENLVVSGNKSVEVTGPKANGPMLTQSIA